MTVLNKCQRCDGHKGGWDSLGYKKIEWKSRKRDFGDDDGEDKRYVAE